jgi:hypothetical protein
MIFVVLAVVIAAGLGFWLLQRSTLSKSEEAAAVRAAEEALVRQAQARCESNLAVWSPMLENLPIIDPATSSLMHEPIYDCVGRRFELPCAHASYDRTAGARHLGMPFGMVLRRDLADTLAEFAALPTGSIVLVRAGEACYLIYSDAPTAPGAMVQRYVRTGRDEYMIWGWRTGADRAAGAIDPLLRVAEVLRKPELWAERLDRQTKAWQDNADCRTERNHCPHRLHIIAAA